MSNVSIKHCNWMAIIMTIKECQYSYFKCTCISAFTNDRYHKDNRTFGEPSIHYVTKDNGQDLLCKHMDITKNQQHHHDPCSTSHREVIACMSQPTLPKQNRRMGTQSVTTPPLLRQTTLIVSTKLVYNNSSSPSWCRVASLYSKHGKIPHHLSHHDCVHLLAGQLHNGVITFLTKPNGSTRYSPLIKSP